MEILEIAKNLLKNYVLCDNCLGRQFALLAHGLSNKERGSAVKLFLTIEAHKLALAGNEEGVRLLQVIATNGFYKTAVQTLEAMGIEAKVPPLTCDICKGTFETLDELHEDIIEMLEEYEFETFLVGVKAPADVEDKEDEVRAKFDIKWGESIRNEFSREIGKRITEKTGKQVNYKRPDVLIVINPFTKRVTIQVNSIFISGKYRKLVRDLPQTRWMCRECGGRGCLACNWTGKMYPESVEELITKPTLELTEGKHAKFHAAGREDVESLVLGSGRSFIIEVKKPKKRFIDLEKLKNMINQHASGRVEVSHLEFSSKEGVKKIKAKGRAEKVYRMVIKFNREISDEELLKLENTFTNSVIQQSVPARPSYHRPEQVREKRIYEAKLKRLKPNLIEMLIRCQGGLYVKELITGDRKRTKPSVSEIINAKAECAELDVMEVNMEEVGDGQVKGVP